MGVKMVGQVTYTMKISGKFSSVELELQKLQQKLMDAVNNTIVFHEKKSKEFYMSKRISTEPGSLIELSFTNIPALPTGDRQVTGYLMTGENGPSYVGWVHDGHQSFVGWHYMTDENMMVEIDEFFEKEVKKALR